MKLVRRARALTACVLSAYGRAVIGVAGRVAPPRVVPVGPRAPHLVAVDGGLPDAVPPGARGRDVPRESPVARALDASEVDLTALRAAALDSTLAAALDPTTAASERFSARVAGVSSWTAGRLLADTERIRLAAIEVSRSLAGRDAMVPRARFTTALRREFPWLSDAATMALWDHAVLVVGPSS